MVGQELLVQAADTFGFEVDTLVFLSNSSNEVYRFSKNNQHYILRLSQRPSAYVEQIKAEVDWVYYLAHNGVHASMPIHTSDHQLTAVYSQGGQCFIATAFHMASGRFFDKNNPQLWALRYSLIGEKRWGRYIISPNHIMLQMLQYKEMTGGLGTLLTLIYNKAVIISCFKS